MQQPAGNMEAVEGMAMQRHSISRQMLSRCFRPSLSDRRFHWQVVLCVLYHGTERGLIERDHSDNWPDILKGLQGEKECPPAA